MFSRMSRCGYTIDGCRNCGAASESPIHALRDCRAVRKVWENRVPTSFVNLFFQMDWKYWININLDKRIHVEEDWSHLWATSCHMIWRWRNKELHEDSYLRSIYLYEIIDKCVKDYHEAMLISHRIMVREKAEKFVKWMPPRMSFMKVNVDGAHDTSGISGCGGIICYEHGTWHGGFFIGIGICSVLVAELWSILVGLRMAKDLGYRRIEVESDSKRDL